MSSLVNALPPANPDSKSSIFGIVYRSSLETGFMVTLKSPHIQTALSDFSTGTMGAA